MSRESDNLQEPSDIRASKVMDDGIKTTDKVSFGAKISVDFCIKSVFASLR